MQLMKISTLLFIIISGYILEEIHTYQITTRGSVNELDDINHVNSQEVGGCKCARRHACPTCGKCTLCIPTHCNPPNPP
ncbi:hypothetical protein PGT21_020075 [Puccinia graminis f. sp. tritici]|uniref:Uncharacterized protein n=1 Tax=Puccinia graminis f. sp. tritici TaxID=56615 RepID=A0A5B0QGA5_PUCGR|nr:hypothetical protein PGT21_020075 [Puccinia graminis f. sp. tritici]